MKNILGLATMCLFCTSTIAQSQPERNRDLSLYNDITANLAEHAQPLQKIGTPGLSRRAEYPGGDKALQAYLSSGFTYPQVAVENGLEGTVRVRFTVSKSGKPVDPKVTHSVHPVIDREVVRLILSMEDWSPSLKHGNPIPSIVEIPFTLALR